MLHKMTYSLGHTQAGSSNVIANARLVLVSLALAYWLYGFLRRREKFRVSRFRARFPHLIQMLIALPVVRDGFWRVAWMSTDEDEDSLQVAFRSGSPTKTIPRKFG